MATYEEKNRCTCSGSPGDPDYTPHDDCPYPGHRKGPPHFVSASCAGEECSVGSCVKPATHKLAEDVPTDEPCPDCGEAWNVHPQPGFDPAAQPPGKCISLWHHMVGSPRHGLTAYVCCGHFKMIVGRAAPCGETSVDHAGAAWALFQQMMGQLRASVDEADGARNYVSVEMSGLKAPFSRAIIEFSRPGGLSAGHVAAVIDGSRKIAAARLRTIVGLLKVGAQSDGIAHLVGELEVVIGGLEFKP